MLGNVVQIIPRFELRVLASIGINDTDITVVEIHLVVGVYQSHVVCSVLVDISHYQVDVCLVRQDDVGKGLQREPRKLDRCLTGRDVLLPVLGSDTFGYTSGEVADRMYHSSALLRDYLAEPSSYGDHLLAGLEADFLDNSEDVPAACGCVGSHYEIRTT